MIKLLSWRFRKYWGRFQILTVKAFYETLLLRQWSNQDFQSLSFWKYVSYDHHLFFQNVSNLIEIAEMEQKIQKKFFLFQIVAFELGVANSRNIEQDTCHRQPMC